MRRYGSSFSYQEGTGYDDPSPRRFQDVPDAPQIEYVEPEDLQPDDEIIPDEEVQRILGPPPEAQEMEAEEFDASPFDQFLERYGAGGGIQMSRPPQNFLEGLLYGAGQGLAGRGQRIAKQREKFDAAQSTRMAQRNRENLAASQKYDERKFQLERDALQSKRTAKGSSDVVVDDAMLKTDPWLAPQLGQRVSKSFVENRRIANAPETPVQKSTREHREKTETLQAEASARAARAAELSQMTESRNALDQLADRYNKDPDILAFQTTTSNLATIEDALNLENGLGDLAATVAYVREIEPGVMSVVREEEKRGVQMSVGRLQQLANLPSNWVKGNLLTPTAREAMREAGRSIAKSRKPLHDQADVQYRKAAKRLNIDPGEFMRERVILDTPIPGSAGSRTPSAQSTPTGRRKASAVFDEAGF